MSAQVLWTRAIVTGPARTRTARSLVLATLASRETALTSAKTLTSALPSHCPTAMVTPLMTLSVEPSVRSSRFRTFGAVTRSLTRWQGTTTARTAASSAPNAPSLTATVATARTTATPLPFTRTSWSGRDWQPATPTLHAPTRSRRSPALVTLVTLVTASHVMGLTNAALVSMTATQTQLARTLPTPSPVRATRATPAPTAPTVRSARCTPQIVCAMLGTPGMVRPLANSTMNAPNRMMTATNSQLAPTPPVRSPARAPAALGAMA